MVVHRLTGDPPKKLLIEPKWAQDKKKVLNTINAALSDEPYYVYMLRCGDGSLYTGSTNNVDKRLKAHKSGAGCKYTRSHQPVELVNQIRIMACKRIILHQGNLPLLHQQHVVNERSY